MSKALKWIKKYWYLPALAALAFLAWIFRLASSPLVTLARERAAIDAGERAKLRELAAGRDLANAEADQEYRAAIRVLNAKQRAKADRLRSNPGARAKWLNRISSKHGAGK